MDSTFVDKQDKLQKKVLKDKKKKRKLILLSSLFFALEYLVFLQLNETVLLVFNSLLILVISYYGHELAKINSKILFVFLSLFIIVIINYFMIESILYRNLFVGLYLLIIGIYTLTVKIQNRNLVFYYWTLFSKVLQIQIALSLVIYSLEIFFEFHFSYGTLFFSGSVLGFYLLYAVFTFQTLKKQELILNEDQIQVERTCELDKIETEILIKLEFFFRESKLYLDIQFSFDDLSKELGVSKEELSKLIHKVYGVSFYKHIAYKRMTIAIERLAKLDNKTTIESVMLDSGFSSKPTFNKYFKEITGVNPSEFIKR